MRIERAIKLKAEAVTRLRDYFSAAKFYGPTAATMDSKVAEIRATLKTAPRWAFSEFEGHANELRDSLYHHPVYGTGPLVYGGFLGGRFYSTHSARADYYGKNGIEPSAWAEGAGVTGKGHYWGGFTPPRPFFTDADWNNRKEGAR